MKTRSSKHKKDIRARILALFLLAVCIVSCYGIYFGVNTIKAEREIIAEGYAKQETEENIADEYLNWLLENADKFDNAYEAEGSSGASETTAETTETDETAKETASLEWYDDAYYLRDGILWTPDYATGYLAFVLEYPKIKVRRGVYCAATYRDIEKDFDNWMTVLYNPNMRLGKTHLWIIGHNSTMREMSFNGMVNAELGDVFYLYNYTGVYTYKVTEIFAEWRNNVNAKYIENPDIPNTVCYIATCGRDYMYDMNGNSTRYRDFVVKGELIDHISLTEYGKLVIDDENKWKSNLDEQLETMETRKENEQ